jgi:hypothetical protein
MCEFACIDEASVAIAAVTAGWLALAGTLAGIAWFTRALFRAWEQDQERKGGER